MSCALSTTFGTILSNGRVRGDGRDKCSKMCCKTCAVQAVSSYHKHCRITSPLLPRRCNVTLAWGKVSPCQRCNDFGWGRRELLRRGRGGAGCVGLMARFAANPDLCIGQCVGPPTRRSAEVKYLAQIQVNHLPACALPMEKGNEHPWLGQLGSSGLGCPSLLTSY